VNLQNFNKSLLSEELVKEIENSNFLNLRSSSIENLHLKSNFLNRIDLKKTKLLKRISLDCPELEVLHLTGTSAETIEIFSDRLLDLNIRGAKDLKALNLQTKRLEHIELRDDQISIFSDKLKKLESLKGINHIYNDNNLPLSEFISNFHKEKKDQIDRHKDNCCCSSCKSEKKIYIEGLEFKLKI
jgi:hypothetical protein